MSSVIVAGHQFKSFFSTDLEAQKGGHGAIQRSTDCWPDWLHTEEGLERVRIALFGYDANFNVFAPNTNVTIPIFANQLLYSIKQLHYRTRPVLISYELV